VKNAKITVYLNDKPKTLYFGMRVKDAIGARRAKAVREHRAIIRDAEGNSIDFDGALYDGERLYLVSMDPVTFADEMQKRADAAFRQ
jgi:hypothetical protein